MIFFYDGQYREGGITLDVAGTAFRCGFGIFETLFWDGTKACRLKEHLARALASLESLGVECGRCDCAVVTGEVALRNGFSRRPGRVNVHFPVQDGRTQPVISIAPYEPLAPDKALRLALSPRPLHTWLGAHKTMNYLYYHLEQQASLREGFDGAALADPDGHLLEAATAALVFSDHGQLVTPLAAGVGDTAAGILPSVALACVSESLNIKARPVLLAELPRFDHAWALNSLMGMRPVARLGEVRFAPEFAPCDAAGRRIFSR